VKTASTASRNDAATNSVILNSRTLANEVSMTATAMPTSTALASNDTAAHATSSSAAVDASPHGAMNTFSRIVYSTSCLAADPHRSNA
jgi:hypothetical protein